MKTLTKWAAISVATVGLSSGCASNMSNAEKGALIGAVTGAVAGKNTGSGSNKRTAIMAVVGAIAGGAIGNYMDKQEAELREELSGTGVGVQREGDNIKLVMPGNITFDTNSSGIKSHFNPVLNDVGKVVRKYNKTSVEVSGHTDNVGSDRYNQKLSEARAASVGNYLVGQGVQRVRVSSIGYGEKLPVASNANDAGRAQNRRVEIQLVPISE